jgi:hypothetical protein
MKGAVMTTDQVLYILSSLVWTIIGAIIGLFLQAWYSESDSSIFRRLKVFVKTIRLNKQNPELRFVFQMRPSDLDALRFLDLHFDALSEKIKSGILASRGKIIREKQPDEETLELEINCFSHDYLVKLNASSYAPRVFEFLEHSDMVTNEADLILIKPAEGITDFLLEIERKTDFKSIRKDIYDIILLGSQIGGQLASIGSTPSFHFILNYPKGFTINLGQTKALIRQAELDYPDGVTALISENKIVISHPVSSKNVPFIIETIVLYSR